MPRSQAGNRGSMRLMSSTHCCAPSCRDRTTNEDWQMEHVLVWKNYCGAPHGFNALLNWGSYILAPGASRFVKRDGAAQIADHVGAAAHDAVMRCRDLTVAWGQLEHPETSSPAELEAAIAKLRPAVLICPERATGDRWLMSEPSAVVGRPESMPTAAVQSAVWSTVSNLYPRWAHGRQWQATCFMLRHSVNGEQLGLVPPVVPTADDLLALVAED